MLVMRTGVLLATLLLYCWSAEAQISGSVPQCRGIFDFYFVLDTSGSVRSNFQTDVVPFVKNISSNFISPDFRLSFVTFATTATIYLNLTATANRNAILKAVEQLEGISPTGNTNLATGIIEVNQQIDKFGGDAASVILVLTDGALSDTNNAFAEAERARMKGASLFAIGVGSARVSELIELTGSQSKVLSTTFTNLDGIIEEVINETCIEIDNASPLQTCLNQSTDIELMGKGFTNTLAINKTACRFLQVGTNDFKITRPTEPVQSNRIVCPVPAFNQSKEVILQVTLNGITFISSNVTLSVNECSPVDAGLAVGLSFLFIFLLILAALIALWFFFPLITGVTISRKPPEDPEKPKDKPGKKWDTVDASYYGGGGVGGIKPVTVRWGDKGATEEGDKLSKAKDANVVATNTIPGYSAPTPPKIGCWSAFKTRFLSGYTIAASYRPVRGTKKRIEWHPFSGQNATVSDAKIPPTAQRTLSGSYQTRPSRTSSVQSDKRSPSITRPAPRRPPPPPNRGNTISS